MFLDRRLCVVQAVAIQDAAAREIWRMLSRMGCGRLKLFHLLQLVLDIGFQLLSGTLAMIDVPQLLALVQRENNAARLEQFLYLVELTDGMRKGLEVDSLIAFGLLCAYAVRCMSA